MASPTLRVEHLGKAFGSTVALRDVSLEVQAGEVHALLGHNGSGKSTLIKILAGYHRPDSGSVVIDGTSIAYPTNAFALQRLGVAFLHQDIGLVPTMSVMENIRIGHLSAGRLGRVHWREERRRVAALLESFDLSLSPELPVGRLSAAERAVVGILRAAQAIPGGRGLLVLDEPTAALPAAETAKLFDIVRTMAARGTGVLFVTHHLSEPLELASRVSVLRDGQLVVTADVHGLTEEALAKLIVGREIQPVAPSPDERPGVRQIRLQASNLRGATVADASFVAQRGEMLGLTGLMGAGHQEVPFLVYGALPSAGTISIDGEAHRPNPSGSRRRGIALVSGDRVAGGGILGASVRENLSLPILDRLVGPLGWIHHRKEQASVQEMLQRFRVTPSDPRLPFSALSGGNQQKALVGRWLESNPRLLLLQEPTSGVDIGAVEEINGLLRHFASTGGTVVWSSEQYEDLAKMCDRVIVFVQGEIVAELTGSDLDPDIIVSHCYRSPMSAASHHDLVKGRKS